jgi:hypothetical protein
VSITKEYTALLALWNPLLPVVACDSQNLWCALAYSVLKVAQVFQGLDVWTSIETSIGKHSSVEEGGVWCVAHQHLIGGIGVVTCVNISLSVFNL